MGIDSMGCKNWFVLEIVTQPKSTMNLATHVLPQDYGRDYQIGISLIQVWVGDNTRKALKRLQSDVLVHNPDLVTVLIGTADASEQKHVAIQEYQENLTAIVRQISPARTILISSPPIDYDRLLARKQAFPLVKANEIEG